MDQVHVALSGVGGYAQLHINELLSDTGKRRAKLVGAVDPYPSGDGFARLLEEGVPVYASLPELYERHSPVLSILSCPTPYHAEQAVYCLEHNSHVLVEKPIAPSVEAAETMIRARDAAKRTLVVGYQWCFNDAMNALKDGIRSGRYGAPKTLRAIVLWPRDQNYYTRGIGWAGKRYSADNREAFDNVASNATAHYLMNMLWMAGCGENGTVIADVEASAFRANNIETYDSICLSLTLSNGARIVFAASHTVGRHEVQHPMFSYEFERATFSYGVKGGQSDQIRLTTKDGEEAVLGDASTGSTEQSKIWKTLDIIDKRIPNLCPPELAIWHTRALALADRVVADNIRVFSPDEINVDGQLLWVPGVADTLFDFYNGVKTV
ncbi:MAG: Gfo/Idh/MocA family oxidoreductase [Oscillospiraceae bacterium]|jgi:predicted dehydrogenase|nr:Gfo/Idh/MocA family oxidoreductase [Oscillospiraceae bacterium]